MQSVFGAIYRSQELYTAYCPSVVQRVVEYTGNGFDHLVDNVVQCVHERMPNIPRPELTVAFTASAMGVVSSLSTPPIVSFPLNVLAIATIVSALRNGPHTTVVSVVGRVRQLCTNESLPLRLRLFLMQHVFENRPLYNLLIDDVEHRQTSDDPQPATCNILLAAAFFLQPTLQEALDIQRLLPLPSEQRNNTEIQKQLASLYIDLLDKAVNGEPCDILRWLQQTCSNKRLELSFRLRLVQEALGVTSAVELAPYLNNWARLMYPDNKHEQALAGVTVLSPLIEICEMPLCLHNQALLQASMNLYNLKDPNLHPVLEKFFQALVTELSNSLH